MPNIIKVHQFTSEFPHIESNINLEIKKTKINDNNIISINMEQIKTANTYNVYRIFIFYKSYNFEK